MSYARYAIYYTPPQSPFAAFCTAWLGWDMAAGLRVTRPDVAGLQEDPEALTETPRRYGLHATIKPPFQLAKGVQVEALDQALASFCQKQAPIMLAGLQLSRLGRFLALTQVENNTGLTVMASRVVRDFDIFRAPLTDAQTERRQAAGLTPRQKANLVAWGYPYVMEDFRFHITLTGKMPKAQVAPVMQSLQAVLTPLLPRPFVVEGLSLAGEDAKGQFHLIQRYGFGG